MTTATAGRRDDLKLGGQYRAIDNGDGTYDILDVAVFAEVPAGAKRNKDHIGREWQYAAIMKNKAREREGHLPPVHIYHTDDENVKPIHAGKLRLKNLKQIIYQGDKIWATFGDILGMPGEVFEKVRKGFLPYRSVEIHNWDNTEIDSLSLMDTDVPYFRMEMITIGEVIKRFKSSAELFMGKRNPVAVACRIAEAPSMSILFKFEDDKKKSDEEDGADPLEDSDADATPKDTAKDPNLEEPAPASDPDATPDGEADPDAQLEAEAPGDAVEGTQDDPMGEPDPDAAMEDGAAEAADPMSLLKALKAAVDQILQRIAPQPPAQESAEPVSGFKDKEISMSDTKKAAGTAPATMKADDIKAMFKEQLEAVVKPLEGKITMLETENVALKAKHAADAQAVVVESRFRAGVDKLKSKRINLSDKALELLKKGAADEAFFNGQVELFMDTMPADPAPDADTFEDELATGSASKGAAMVAGNESVQKFMDAHPGPEAAAWVKAQLVSFRAYRKAATSSDMSQAEWLETNWRAESMHETNRV